MTLPATIRPARETDVAFIVDSWLRSYRADRKQAGDPIGFVPSAEYGRGQRAVIARCLERGATLVSCDPEDDNVIHGWASAGDDGELDYVFVRQDLRGFGVARALLAAAGVPTVLMVVTHWTRACNRWHAKHGAEVVYSPYRAWGV